MALVMRIGHLVQMIGAALMAFVFFLDLTLSHGPPSNRGLSPGVALSLSK